MAANVTPRLTDAEAVEVYRRLPLHELGRRAAAACDALHPEPWRTYIVDRNVNYSNVCTAACRFCAFHAPAGTGGWALSIDQVLEEVRLLADIGGTGILLQGGLHPRLPLQWYLDLLRSIKAAFPSITVHGFSPPEIVHLGSISQRGIVDVLDALHAAGLDSIPGGGAEILVDRVRGEISPRKCGADQWLSVMRCAHGLEMTTTATMMFGHVETDADRIEHLRRLRDLQDESLAAGRGRFTAFICWTFQPGNTALAAHDSLRLAGGHDYLRTLALSRLYLDNFANIQASWVTQGPKVGQLALAFGANDMGSVMMTEKVVAAAGTSYRLDERAIRRLIAAAGYRPRRRDYAYRLRPGPPGPAAGVV